MIDESLAAAPVVDRGGYAYLIHPLTDGIPRTDPELLEAWVDWAIEQPALKDATVLLAPEAMAIPLATALSLRARLPFLVVRKRQYGLAGEAVAYCETGYGQSCLYINGLRADDRVVVIDDVLSTGGTLEALLGTLKGMEVRVQGALVFIEKGERGEEISARTGIDIAVMRRVRVADGKVAVESPEGS